MITMTLDIASVFLGMCLGCFMTLAVCWLGGMF